MKRELKVDVPPGVAADMHRHKANPDEKGTESGRLLRQRTPGGAVTKPIPMKRELKACATSIMFRLRVSVTKPIPMKRELKVDQLKVGIGSRSVTKPIPMKRELKGIRRSSGELCASWVTKPIPMKRELKAMRSCSSKGSFSSHKANPDEMGTESDSLL